MEQLLLISNDLSLSSNERLEILRSIIKTATEGYAMVLEEHNKNVDLALYTETSRKNEHEKLGLVPTRLMYEELQEPSSNAYETPQSLLHLKNLQLSEKEHYGRDIEL